MLIIRLFNLALLKRQLKNFPIAVQKRILRALVRAGATVIRKEFKANLKGHKRTGAMTGSLAVKVVAYKGVMVGMVGIRKDIVYADKRGNPVVPRNYNHLVEMGHASWKRVWYNKKKNQKFKDGKPRYYPAVRGIYPLKNAQRATLAAVKLKMYEVFKAQVAKEAAKL